MAKVQQGSADAEQTRRTARARYPWWAPRFWHGMRLGDWWNLLQRNGFRVHPSCWAMAASITGISAMNSVLSYLAEWLCGKRVAATSLQEPPLFILGHWRSGTTYLHQLLAHDPRFVTPNSYECFVPNHFVISESWLPRLFWFIMPNKRPMDDVRAGWFEPQEDEFALCGMGVPSPYLRMAFPSQGPVYLDYLDMRGLDPSALNRWKASLHTFLQRITFLHRKRVVLKSPTHTGRVGLLARMFPGAKFIHIVRHPYELFPSTMRLWQALDEVQGLQTAYPSDRLQEFVLTSLERMYDGYWSQKSTLPEGSLYEIRYEDLVADPIGQLSDAYQHLNLGDFSQVEPGLRAFLSQSKDYHRHQYRLPAQEQDLIRSRWSSYMEAYGYQDLNNGHGTLVPAKSPRES